MLDGSTTMSKDPQKIPNFIAKTFHYLISDQFLVDRAVFLQQVNTPKGWRCRPSLGGYMHVINTEPHNWASINVTWSDRPIKDNPPSLNK